MWWCVALTPHTVAPAELEGLLLDHPDVADVCVIGAPDEYSGELPFAFITPKEETQTRISRAPAEEQRVRDAITEVHPLPSPHPKRPLTVIGA